MLKKEFISKIKTKTNVEKQHIEPVLDAMGEIIVEALAKKRDEKITLPGIGKFSVKHVNAKSGLGINGKPWEKPAHDEIVFKVSDKVKELD